MATKRTKCTLSVDTATQTWIVNMGDYITCVLQHYMSDSSNNLGKKFI